MGPFALGTILSFPERTRGPWAGWLARYGPLFRAERNISTVSERGLRFNRSINPATPRLYMTPTPGLRIGTAIAPMPTSISFQRVA